MHMQYFDFEKVAREANIPKDTLAELCRMMRAEFPHDDMMYELHVLRACLAVRDGRIRVEDLMPSEQPANKTS